MKHVSIFGIWREICALSFPTFHANCWLIKCFFGNMISDYAWELHEKNLTLLGKIRLSSLFSQINWSYNHHNMSAAIWDQKILLTWNPTYNALIVFILVPKWRSHLLIELCAIEYSFGHPPTALKHGDEACLHIWHLTWKLSSAPPNLSCELLTDKINLLKKCFSAIWFLTIWTTRENSDIAWENSFKFII